jgi:[ribosomal protein S18]-alanine N-acetyltransferase
VSELPAPAPVPAPPGPRRDPASRPATAADLAGVVAVQRACFARPWSEESVRDELSRADRAWRVVVVGGQLVAVGGVAALAGEAHVLSLAVRPEARRRGLARHLVLALLADAREQLGCDRVTLEVRASNVAARALYRACGFVEVGVRPGYYQDDREDAVVLWYDAGASPRPPHPHTPTP